MKRIAAPSRDNARPPGRALRRRHGHVRRRQVAGDSRARGSRLLLRRQPAGRADPDVRRSRARRPERDPARGRRRRHPRGPGARALSARLRKAEAPARRRPCGSCFSTRATRRSCGASARRGGRIRWRPAGDRWARPSARSGACCSRCAGSRIRSSTRARSTSTTCARRILESTGGTDTTAPLVVNILSFGFRRGVPPDADLVFDVRFLPNPHFVTALRPWTGRSPRVARFVLRSPAAQRFLQLTASLLQVPDAAVHRRGQDVPHDRDRLHGRTASLGRDCRGARQAAEGACGASSSTCGTATPPKGRMLL